MKKDAIHPFKSRHFLQSLGFALRGLRTVILAERNFRTHLVLAVLVTLGGLILGIDRTEWALLILCMTLMMAVEILNTALEHFTDLLSEGAYHERVKSIKDIAAAACLLTALGVAMAGTLILLPHVWERIS